jgi:hypothetical protein
MRSRQVSVLAIVAVIAACGGEAYKEPAAGSYTITHAQLKSNDALVPVQAAAVTLEFFPSAEVQPLVGRFFIDGDQRDSPVRVVVLSHDLWADRFASSPNVVGQAIELDGHPVTIVGIAPRGFRFPTGTQLWTPTNSIGEK